MRSSHEIRQKLVELGDLTLSDIAERLLDHEAEEERLKDRIAELEKELSEMEDVA